MKVLMWTHKHGVSLYDASTKETLEASAREVLRNLVSMGYVFEPEDPMKHIEYSGIDMEMATLTDEEIDGLPTASLKQEAMKHKSRLERRHQNYARDVEEYEAIVQLAAGETVIGESGREITAWRVLQNRAGAEYEEFEIEHVWTPTA